MTDLRDLMGRMGTGPKSAEDLPYGEARDAFERILDGEPAPVTLGAFLVANRWKRNTPEELAGFVDAMRGDVAVAAPEADPVDCGANYDGKARTALLGVGAGLVAAAAGTPVVVHSADRVPVQAGTAYRHVLDALGVETNLAPEASAAMVDDAGFGFYDATRFNPRIHALLDRRGEVGVRTFVNTVETLANPAGASVHLGSFFHLAFAHKLAEAIERSGSLGFERAIFFQGLEGYDDVRPGQTPLAEWENGEVTDDEIRTAAYGLDVDEDDLAVGDVAADSARITEEVLAGEREDGFADAVALNAALRIYARGDADDLADGLERARKAIADGDALDRLEALRAFEAPATPA